jgi:PAS domain S-box-containing protein
MSEKIITETLHGIGLTEKDIQVYIQLAKKGPTKARDITKSIKITKAQVYRSLKNLQSKGIVDATIETPQTFTALPFEKVFNLYVKIKNEEVHRIEKNRKEALKQWKSITLAPAQNLPDRFMVIEGKRYIYTKIQEMVNKSQKEVLVATNSASILEADLDSALDKFLENNKTSIKLVSEISPTNYEYIDGFLRAYPKNIQGKHIELKDKIFPRFLIIDEHELIFITAGFENAIENKTESALWTNNKSLIQSFKTFFYELWQDGVDFKERIKQIRSGQDPNINQIIKDPKEANKLVFNLMTTAKKEILIIATESDLKFIVTRKGFFEDWKKREIDVKILVPISEKNREFSQDLSEYAKIRHTQAKYFRIVVVDGKHIIQLKSTKEALNSDTIDSIFESTLYTNEPEFVKGIHELFLDLWDNSPEEINELKRNLTRFRAVFDNSDDAIILATKESQVITANEAACKMFKMTKSEIEKSNRNEILILDRKAIDAIKKYEATGKIKAELTCRRKDGTTFQGDTTASIFTDIDGKTKHCVIIRDITEIKKAQANPNPQTRTASNKKKSRLIKATKRK